MRLRILVFIFNEFGISIPGACPGFLKGGGPISLGSLKKRSSDFKRGGSNGLMGGGGSSTLVSLRRQILHI